MDFKMLTIKEAAAAVDGLTEYRVRQLVIDGTLPSVKAGRKYLICSNVLFDYLQNPDKYEQPDSHAQKIRLPYSAESSAANSKRKTYI